MNTTNIYGLRVTDTTLGLFWRNTRDLAVNQRLRTKNLYEYI